MSRHRGGRRRWEIVARLATRNGDTWIVPASEGRHYRPTWHGARVTAWKWTRRARRRDQQSIAGTFLRMTWEIRREARP